MTTLGVRWLPRKYDIGTAGEVNEIVVEIDDEKDTYLLTKVNTLIPTGAAQKITEKRNREWEARAVYCGGPLP